MNRIVVYMYVITKWRCVDLVARRLRVEESAVFWMNGVIIRNHAGFSEFFFSR